MAVLDVKTFLPVGGYQLERTQREFRFYCNMCTNITRANSISLLRRHYKCAISGLSSLRNVSISIIPRKEKSKNDCRVAIRASGGEFDRYKVEELSDGSILFSFSNELETDTVEESPRARVSLPRPTSKFTRRSPIRSASLRHKAVDTGENLVPVEAPHQVPSAAIKKSRIKKSRQVGPQSSEHDIQAVPVSEVEFQSREQEMTPGLLPPRKPSLFAKQSPIQGGYFGASRLHQRANIQSTQPAVEILPAQQDQDVLLIGRSPTRAKSSFSRHSPIPTRSVVVRQLALSASRNGVLPSSTQEQAAKATSFPELQNVLSKSLEIQPEAESTSDILKATPREQSLQTPVRSRKVSTFSKSTPISRSTTLRTTAKKAAPAKTDSKATGNEHLVLSRDPPRPTRLPSRFSKQTPITSSSPLRTVANSNTEPAERHPTPRLPSRPPSSFSKRCPISRPKIPVPALSPSFTAPPELSSLPSSTSGSIVEGTLPGDAATNSQSEDYVPEVSDASSSLPPPAETNVVHEQWTGGIEELASLRLTELKDIAKSRGIKGYYRLKKADLVQKLTSNLTSLP